LASIDDSSEYYFYREQRERELAKKEGEDALRALRLELADKYADLARKALAGGR
jgi:hypothetical protein